MKRLILTLVAALISVGAMADEGMWLLPYLQKMNIKDMKAKGCRLSAEDIYSINKNSIKDAIVIFGNGCTGEVVSSEGLLFTNHHCGYGSIQALSSVEHDYLKYGFWANNHSEEIPAPGLTVRFIREISDVTAQITGNIPANVKESERNRMVAENAKNLQKELKGKNKGKDIQIKSFFGGNQFFAFVIETFRDIRLVGTPPSSIGKFGGETDNWMWPRHTGDFSVFRIYADKDNNPADYSKDNVPYKAEKYLKVSLKGYEEGDFAMVMGFPGSTQRYMTSYEIDDMLTVSNPNRIFIRGERQAILKKDMAASDKVRIQYASKYARSSNYWKNSIGMSRGLKRLDVKSKKAAQEKEFSAWALQFTLADDPRYGEALPLIKGAMEGKSAIDHDRQYLQEAFLMAVEIITPARLVAQALNSPKKQESKKSIATLMERLKGWYKDYNAPTDRKVAKRMLAIARDNMKVLPSIYEVIDRDFGGNIDAYVDNLYDNSIFADEAKVLAALENMQTEEILKDPAQVLQTSVMTMFRKLTNDRKPFVEQYAEGHRLYIDGLMKMQPEKAWASDANFSIRLTYGNVLPYTPQDGVRYSYYTTLKGVMEKENPENPTEFFVPEKLKELYAARDYGRYANHKGELPVAFLSNLDITGGNSGSPILNGKGELIGLAFDGNWEAMSGDVAFEPELQRCIGVDVRYVLFIIEKFAGAKWLIDELDIAK
ncbi:MAG: S46 family peptidase [Alistipes sp.]|nr:S46 family peptidase [Alistipes sp.]